MRALYLANGNSQFKFADTTTEIRLNAFDDGSPATLSADAKVRIKNDSGYLLGVSASITNNQAVITSGQLSQLPAGSYLLELWDTVDGGTAIYPSEGFLALQINDNVTGLSGKIVSSITVDDFIKQFSDLSQQLRKEFSDSQAEVDQKVSSLSSKIDSLNSAKASSADLEAVKNCVSAVESGKADKTSVYNKETADGRYLQRDASTTLKFGSVLSWDDSGHATDDSNVPFTAGGLRWFGKTDMAEIRAEETGTDNLDLVFDLGDDGSNSVDFRWNNISKAKVNSSGKFTGHVDWANVDGKDTYTRAEVDTKLSAKADTTSLKATADSLTASIANAQGDIRNLQHKTDNIDSTVSNLHAGDRNLARGLASSKDWYVFQGFNNYTNHYYDLVTYSLETLKAGDVVTFGITMKNDGVTSGTMHFQQHGDVSGWDRDFADISPETNVTDFVPNGAEKTVTYTIPITAGMLNGNSTYTIQIRTDNVPAGGKLSFRYAFVKKGTLATDWTPAPEEVDDSIFQIKQAANQIQAQVNDNNEKISSVTQKANSLDSKMPQAAYVPVVLGDKTDLNSMKTCGFYMIRGETINSPVGGLVYIKVLGTPDRLTQFAWQDIDPAQQWCRWYDGNNWTPWTRYTQAL